MAARGRKQLAPVSVSSVLFGEPDAKDAKTLRKLHGPVMRYVPELSLPEMMCTRHLEREKQDWGGSHRSTRPATPAEDESIHSASPSHAGSKMAVDDRRLNHERQISGNTLSARGSSIRHIEPPGVAAAAKAGAMSSRGLGNGAFAKNRQLHPRLRFARYAKQADAVDPAEDAPPDAAGGGGLPPGVVEASVAHSAGEDAVLQRQTSGAPSEPPARAPAGRAVPPRKGRMECPPHDRAAAVALGFDSRCEHPRRPALLPRPSPRAVVVPGTASTSHAPKWFHDPGGSRRPSSSSLTAPSESEASDPGALLASDELQHIDRKWFMRLAPISCLPGESSAKPARRRYAATALLDRPPESGATPGAGSAPGRANSVSDALLGECGEYLNFQNWGLSDDYLRALLSAHAATSEGGISGVRHVDLSENRLSDRGVSALVGLCDSRFFRSLSLASNRLTERGALRIVELLPSCSRLRDLTLDGNNLGDIVVERLCRALLTDCRELEGLGLARCGIGQTVRGGTAIGEYVSSARQLRALDLNWNMLRDEGAHSLLRGVYENNVEMSGHLQRLNLAWNRMGSGSFSADACRRSKAATTAKLLADTLKHGEVLYHLDLSYNCFNAEECESLAKALLSNHTLFGIHLVGNDATVDDMGFVIPLVGDDGTGVAPAVAAPPAADEGVLDIGDIVQLALGKPLPKSSARQAVETQEALNQVLGGVPTKYHFSHPIEAEAKSMPADAMTSALSTMSSRRALLAEAGASTPRLGHDPSLATLAKGGSGVAAPTFSAGDISSERRHIQKRGQVQTIPEISGGDAHMVHRNARCCWICENWVEHKIVYAPTRPIPKVGGQEVAVHVLFGIDGFARPIKMAKVEDSKFLPRRRTTAQAKSGRCSLADALARVQRQQQQGGKYIVYRMLPPTVEPMEVVFMVNGVADVSAEMLRKKLSSPKVVPPCHEVTGMSTAKEVIEVNLLTVPDGISAASGPPLLCVLGDPKQRSGLRVVPRPGISDDAKSEVRPPWSFETSVFQGFVRDHHVDMEVCFHFDWESSRLDQLIKGEDSTSAVYECLSGLHLRLMAAYWSEAFGALSGNENVAGIGLGDFRELLLRMGGEGPKELFDGRTTFLRDADCIFSAAIVVERHRRAEFQELPGRELCRFQFMEAVVRMAFRRFLKNDGVIIPFMYVEAIESFIALTGIGEQLVQSRQELHRELFKEECDSIIRDFYDMLWPIFQYYRDLGRKPGVRKVKNMTYSNWALFLKDAQIIDDEFSMAKAGDAFALGRCIHSDETSTLRHMELSWSEFLVCLAAVAKLRSHLEDEETLRGISFAELFDEFLGTYIPDALNNLVSASAARASKRQQEFAPMVEVLERVFSELDAAHRGVISVSGLERKLKTPACKAQLAKAKLTSGEAGLLIRRLREDGSARSTPAPSGPANSRTPSPHPGGSREASMEQITEALTKVREATRPIHRALLFIDKSFHEYDFDDSGSLDIDEFAKLLHDPGLVRRFKSAGIDDSDLGRALDVLQEEGVEDLTMELVVDCFLRLRDPDFVAQRGLRVLKAYFNESRAARSGALNKEDVIATFGVEAVAAQLAPCNLKVPDWSTMFEELDTDGSGDLTWDEISEGVLAFWRSSFSQTAMAPRA